MNIGKMCKRIRIMQLEEQGDVYAWALRSSAWAAYEKQTKSNIFSKVGIGALSVLFTLRKCKITPHNAIEFDGRHYFITDIAEKGAGFIAVSTALVNIVQCRTYEQTETLSAVNTPILKKELALTFPACLTEKYTGYKQAEAMARIENTMVLVTPSTISLNVGDVVEIGTYRYCVEIRHELDEFKHEYEITLREDA